MLSNNEIQNIVNIIITGYQPEKIIIFGSYSQGTANDSSDLDLLIVKKTNENFFKRNREIRHLFNPMPVPMDLLVYNPSELSEKQSVINHIVNIAMKEGKIVYERKL